MFKAIVILIGGLLIQGCATVTSGTTSSIAVVTDPPGATCNLRRDGQIIAIVNPTPGTATVSKSVKPIAVDCTRAGGQPGAAVIQPEFQPMTIGNVLLGGVIGLVIDAASGAMGTYPPNIIVALAPDRFDSTVQRDTFYQTRAEEVRRLYDERMRVVRENCTPGAQNVCDDTIASLLRERDEELRKLDELRRSAPLAGASS